MFPRTLTRFLKESDSGAQDVVFKGPLVGCTYPLRYAERCTVSSVQDGNTYFRNGRN